MITLLRVKRSCINFDRPLSIGQDSDALRNSSTTAQSDDGDLHDRRRENAAPETARCCGGSQLEALEYIGHTNQFENHQYQKHRTNDAESIGTRHLILDTVHKLQ